MQFEQKGSYQQNTDKYVEPFSRMKRGLLVFLLDQSASMSEQTTLGGFKLTLAQMATNIINDLLAAVVGNAKVDPQTGQRKDNCDILVYGYGEHVIPLLNNTGTPVSVPALAANPRGRHRVRVTKYDPIKGQNVSSEEEQPFWILPSADSRRTEMAQAIRIASRAVQNWLAADPRRNLSFPPIVINITDGRPNSANVDNPIQESLQLRQLCTEDGAVLLFNCHITISNAQSLTFPGNIAQIQQMNFSNEDRVGIQQLFEMSSVVPVTMASRAQQVFQRSLNPGARGFMYNASGQDLINFLSWGTRQGPEFTK